MTQQEDLAIFLAYAVKHLGGSLKIKKTELDKMLPTRLVWDSTSDPDYITVATISNDVIMLTVEPTDIVQKKD